MRLKLKLLICALATTLSTTMLANTEPEHIDIPHVHGIAHAQVAVAENTVVISFQSPAYNLLGFESHVATPKELKEFRKAQHILGNVVPLFDFNGTLCNSVNVELDFSDMTTAHDHLSENQTSALAKDDEHHGDVNARYDFLCNDASALTSISMPIVNVFPLLDSMNVEWVTDSGSGETSVNAASSEVSLQAP